MPGLYLHIPFCIRKCRYCDFISFAGITGLKEYFHALKREMALAASMGAHLTFDTVFFGGGTPSIAPEGEIVKAVYNSGVEKVLHRSTEGEVFLPIVILQNGYTASSSEVMIAALQDYDKVLTVGTTSYGKFVMQEIHQFTDGSAVKLTTAQLFSPNGNSFNGSGITPDYVVSNSSGELFPVSLLDPTHDEQLAKALEVASDWSKSYSYPVDPDAEASEGVVSE